MSISNAKIKALVKQAFTIVGGDGLTDSTAVTITYIRVSATGNYNPDTNVQSKTTQTLTGIVAFAVRMKSQEVDYFPAEIRTVKLLIAGLDLPFVPDEEDSVVMSGVTWSVRRVNRVPGDSLYQVFIQEP